MKAVILAGGRATRLGPLTAQMNKSLVSIGQRPLLIHQLDLLRLAGVEEVIVVTSPQSKLQVSDVLERSMGGLQNIEVKCTVQEFANGPADALLVGLRGLSSLTDEGLYVFMADTYISEKLTPGDWIGVAPSTATRSWCYDAGAGYVDGLALEGTSVTIGVYSFSSQADTYDAAKKAETVRIPDSELPMSSFLNEYVAARPETVEKTFSSWLDVGDVVALAHAKRQRFITREANNLRLTERGVLIKSGSDEKLRREALWLARRNQGALESHPANLLFPRLVWTDVGNGSWTSYAVEHVDLPTLAELWLYWPGVPAMWSEVLRGIISRLEQDLWTEIDNPGVGTAWQNTMYVRKPIERLETWHGESLQDRETIEALYNLIRELDPEPRMVTGHGDLNFGNILYSLSTGNFKLVDPRGDDLIDRAYEFAKLRYSYRHGFSAITHDLFELSMGLVRPGPIRDREVAAMDEVMSEYVDLKLVQAIEATIFLSACPLHTGEQQEAMYRQGMKLAKEVLGGSVAERRERLSLR